MFDPQQRTPPARSRSSLLHNRGWLDQIESADDRRELLADRVKAAHLTTMRVAPSA
jgi:hypothetical protein